ncbi:glycosyltransferase [Leptolyngbya sp. FACHB-261]|uniref:glycosyltransferase family 2 protein n=1 Tax=Leptolyngbya sp. FACHB-261 TaxID=2692806 RepID=UPI001687A042|nr:glycosyltransferase [Leptolyngbya sp. FACHB-261]MBD2105044.1 glycosyltransferase family 2 protein [Leptolyngbya sp. FACHB-261]
MLVSILINNYNYGSFLRQAIDSALSQTYPHIEVIVVDDGSTDDSRAIIASYQANDQGRVQSVLKENGGQASAFNAGFAASQGDIICFLDADDLFLPEKVTEVVHTFKDHPEIGWCFHPLKRIDIETNTLLPNSEPEGASRICDFRAQIPQGKLPFSPPPTSGLCFKRSLLAQILPMPEVIRITSDNYLKLTALVLNQGYCLAQNLAIQRIHGNNAYTFRTDKQQLRAKIRILTAYWMKQKFPALTGFTHRLLANGISTCWRLKDAEAREAIEQYLAKLSLAEKLEIQARTLYYRLKFYGRKL